MSNEGNGMREIMKEEEKKKTQDSVYVWVCTEEGFHNVDFTVWCLTRMKGGMWEMTDEEMEGREQTVGLQRDTKEERTMVTIMQHKWNVLNNK